MHSLAPMLAFRRARSGHEETSRGCRKAQPGRRERGSALVLTLLVATVLGAAGISYVTLGEDAVARAVRLAERERATMAARSVVELAAGWLSLPEEGSATLPAPGEWITTERRGDSDGDGFDDATCDGSQPAGRLDGWRKKGAGFPFAPSVRDLSLRALCGSESHPDLLLYQGPFTTAAGSLFGDQVLVERVAIYAPERLPGATMGAATVSCTVSTWRNGVPVARVRASATVLRWPSLRGPEVIAAGGRVTLAPGSTVHWGAIQAGGDLTLPPPGIVGYPASGLPRGGDGRTAMDYTPGSRDDWDQATWQHEYLLTELLGQTWHGKLRSDGPAQPPPLPDPWLSVRAGHALIFEPPRKDTAARLEAPPQPFPYVRGGDLAEDMSHLSIVRPAQWDPLLGGAVDALAARAAAGTISGAGSRVRVLDLVPGAPGSSEPLWADRPGGSGRPATEWLRGTLDAPALTVFRTNGVPVAQLTLGAGGGLVIVSAQHVTLVDGHGPENVAVDMPGEPFEDSGIDANQDGVVDPGTQANQKWDVDADHDGKPDDAPPDPQTFDALYGALPWFALPRWDQDPRFQPSVPHEPYLNLDYPTEARDLSVRVSLAAGAGSSGQPVDAPAGQPAHTTTARDPRGARVVLPLTFRGVVANLSGDVEIAAGTMLHGAVRASGDVTVDAGAFVTFDEALATDGWPAHFTPPGSPLSDLAVKGLLGSERLAGSARRESAAAPDAEPGGPSAGSSSPPPPPRPVAPPPVGRKPSSGRGVPAAGGARAR